MYDPNMEGGNELGGGTPYDGQNYGPPTQGPIDTAADIIKQHGKQIVTLIILGIIGFFVYDYFIGSLVNVTIEARDTEGKLVGGMDGKLFAEGNNSPIKSFSGSTTLSLRPGEYRVEWDASSTSYENPEDSLITVSKEDQSSEKTEKAIAEKNIPVSITNLSFPTALVVGETAATGTLTLENKSTKAQTIELVYEGDFSPQLLSIATQPSTITLNPSQTMPVTLSITVPPTSVVKNIKNGDTKKGTIRIKYTTTSKGTSYTLFKSFSLDVNPKTPQTFSVTANKLFTKTFTIRNTASADSPEGVLAEVQIKSAQNNDLGKITAWFSWNPSPPFNAPKKSENIPVVLNIMAPSTASSDTITGEIKIYTGFWTQTIPFTLNLTEAVVDIKITLDGSATSKKYTINKDAITSQYETKNALLKLENDGSLAIENIQMDAGTCGDYIKQLDTEFFLDLTLAEKGKSGASKTTTLQITAPPTALPGAEQNCLIQVSYIDPKTGDVIQKDPVNVQIET